MKDMIRLGCMFILAGLVLAVGFGALTLLVPIDPQAGQGGQAEQGPLLLDCQTLKAGWGIFERQPDGTWVNDHVKSVLKSDEEAERAEREARLCFFRYGE